MSIPQGIGIKERRYILPYVNFPTASSFSPVAGRVYLELLYDIISPVAIDQISVVNGSAIAGSITVGIYGPLVTEDTCAGSPLIATSTSTAQSGTTKQQDIPIVQTNLNTGRYYVAIEYSSTSAKFVGTPALPLNISAFAQFYDRSGGYGTLTDPCPTITSIPTVPMSIVRNAL